MSFFFQSKYLPQLINWVWNQHTVSIDERRPKMYLLFSHSKNGKFAPFLTYLKIWWKVVLDFGKEHANWSNISEVMIGWSWKIKFGKIHFFLSKCKFKVSKIPILLGLRQKWMIPSCSQWKVITFFSKEHVKWSSFSGVMKGWS